VRIVVGPLTMAQQVTRRLGPVVPEGRSLGAKSGGLFGRVRNEIAVIGDPRGDSYAVAMLTRLHRPFQGVPAVDDAMRAASRTASRCSQGGEQLGGWIWISCPVDVGRQSLGLVCDLRAANVVRRSLHREDDKVVDEYDGDFPVSVGTRDKYWDRLVLLAAGDERRRRTLQRSQLFEQEAERYDRCRPRYPDVVIDALLAPEPPGLEVLDVGCGTGIAARQIAERGAKVLGVELAPGMVAIAGGYGIDVEIGAFEDWDAAGRNFDRVTSAQAWHWLNMPAATAKAASLLRPDGSLGLIWSGGAHPDDIADALEDVYSTVVPSGTHGLFRGYAANRSTDVRDGLDGVIDAITANPDFGAATEDWFPWTQCYQRDEWLELLLTNSQYLALETNLRHSLFEAVGATIDDYGGSFVMNFETVLITAERLG
jgi:SAM-dependent methyltransferase